MNDLLIDRCTQRGGISTIALEGWHCIHFSGSPLRIFIQISCLDSRLDHQTQFRKNLCDDLITPLHSSNLFLTLVDDHRSSLFLRSVDRLIKNFTYPGKNIFYGAISVYLKIIRFSLVIID